LKKKKRKKQKQTNENSTMSWGKISIPFSFFFFFLFSHTHAPSPTDDDDFQAPPVEPPKVANPAQWADEDKEEEVKESWEDEMTTTRPATAAPEKKPVVKKAAKKAPAKSAAQQPQAPVDPVLDKLRKEALVKEADYENAKDLFSGLDEAINTANPKTEHDFEALANLFISKFTFVEVEFFFFFFCFFVRFRLCFSPTEHCNSFSHFHSCRK
jgi:hypothetical protein